MWCPGCDDKLPKVDDNLPFRGALHPKRKDKEKSDPRRLWKPGLNSKSKIGTATSDSGLGNAIYPGQNGGQK